jgi:hypothetical protein
MITEEIYNLAKRRLDGEEFDSDDDALDELNVLYREELSDRDWKFLIKTATLPAGTTDLTTITDLKRVLRVFSSDGTELSKTSIDDRFNTEKDYYIDYANNELALINTDYSTEALTVDYIYSPDDLALDTEPVFPSDYHALLGYRLVIEYKDKDQDFEGYSQAERKYNNLKGLLIEYNESL